jgi:hypothetical protein
MLYPIFKNPKLQKRFEKDGFVVARKVLPAIAVSSLRDLYFKYQAEHYGDRLGFHTSAHTGDSEMLLDISTTIIKTVRSFADQYLYNCKYYLANFLIKESRDDSFVDIHQDWTCVDEPDFCSLNFWMDLGDNSREKGQLFFIKGSHRMTPTLRFAPTCPSPYENIRPIASPFYTQVNTNAGDVVFINNACLHGSTINRSGKSRIAAGIGVHSKETDLLHYYLAPGEALDKIEKYMVSSESLINMARGERPPGGKFCGYVSYKNVPVTEEEFTEFMWKQYTFGEKISYYFRKYFGAKAMAQ